ncbi:MAG: hypothetical protein IJR89_04705 [Clostridia bacterium]|nr:hypothetical protein [Clostridia bacterium]
MTDRKTEAPVRGARIDDGVLRGKDCLSALAEAALACGAMDEEEAGGLRADCFAVLARLLERYAGSETTSVRTETAEAILSSLSYSIGLALKTCETADGALELLRAEKPQRLWERGVKRAENLTNVAHVLYARLKERFFESPNVFWTETVSSELPSFFRLYEPAFSADQAHFSGSYPLLCPVREAAGVELALGYLEALGQENAFLRSFSRETVDKLLLSYHRDYARVPMNLCEPVLTTACGCALLGKKIYPLALTEEDVSALREKLLGAGREKAIALFCGAAEAVFDDCRLPARTRAYFSGETGRIAAAAYAQAEKGSLERIFLTPRREEAAPAVFSFGEPMEDKKYRLLLDKLAQSEKTEEKLALIRRSVRSLADLESLLQDADLSAAETGAILSSISPVEFAALGKRYRIFAGEEGDGEEFSDAETGLAAALTAFLSALPTEQQKALSAAAAQMEIIG